MAVELFISYHEADEEHLRALVTALKPLERGSAKPNLWHRGLARAGEEVEALAARRFETARVIVLLLSNDYLAEDRLYDEATLALERQREGSARVVPVVVRPCNLEETALGGLATLPKGAGTIVTAANKDEAWTGVANETGVVIKEVAAAAHALEVASAAAEPRYRDEATRELGRRLQAALRRRDQLLDEGGDDADLVQEIHDLKRRLREEGQLKAGDVLGERRYRLIELIGEGGYARVWRAEIGAEGQEVALKVLHPHLASDPTCVERFFSGARAMARLRHSGIVRILEQHGEDRGWHYFVMELVRGKNLHDAVLAGKVPGYLVPVVMLAVGDALVEAHRRGMVHRDVKPSNILLDDVGTPKLTDFDLVAFAGSSAGTRTGLVGSYLYTSPELRHRARSADARADIYGLGMTALFCWHGEELPPEVDWEPEAVLEALPCKARTREVLRKAIMKKPEGRHESMATFCEALRAASSGARFEALLSWVDIPAGEFLMGSPAGDEEASSNERLQHRVSVDAFSLSKTPVTVAQYAAVMGRDIGDAAPDLPVTEVTWFDALEFCNALSRLVDREPCYVVNEAKVTWNRRADGFRLPTEAEWEYACRAGTTTRYSFGGDPALLTEHAWFRDNSPYRPHPVGQKRPNPWGLHDMHGNVWEWVWDRYGMYKQGATSDNEKLINDKSTIDISPFHCEQVARGGSFWNGPRRLSSVCRDRFRAWDRLGFLGFRCAASARRQR